MREYSPRTLNYFAWFTLAATLVLICAGGLVTSKGVGMAVPDWPNSYGYNMFFFPVSKWVGGIFYEHLHRLIGAAVGLLTLILAAWLWRKEQRKWVRALGAAAVLAVILQGVLGGLRVVLDKNQLGILHALLAQLFFLLIAAIALVTSPNWPPRSGHLPAILPVYARKRFGYLYFFGTVLIFAQLLLGATMRHQHAGLAIPDFPLAYGRWWPPTDEASLQVINQHRVGVYDHLPITAGQIHLQMAHRFCALLILATTTLAAALTHRKLGPSHLFARLSALWLVLILTQVFLGAATIWSGKSADIATAHVAVGALSLLAGFVLTLLGWVAAREPASFHGSARVPDRSIDFPLNPKPAL